LWIAGVIHAESPPRPTLNRHPLDSDSNAESPPPKTYRLLPIDSLPVVAGVLPVDNSGATVLGAVKDGSLRLPPLRRAFGILRPIAIPDLCPDFSCPCSGQHQTAPWAALRGSRSALALAHNRLGLWHHHKSGLEEKKCGSRWPGY
jgi:hypothetical protein